MGLPDEKPPKPKKVAIGCQGGGMHAAFEVGVLTVILEKLQEFDKLKASGTYSDAEKTERAPYDPEKTFELVGLSGSSAGGLCTLATWYGLAPKPGSSGSAGEAIKTLERVWNDFTADTLGENILSGLAYYAFRLQEAEAPVLGLSTSGLGLNPCSIISKTVASLLPSLNVRKQYFDLMDFLHTACPDFASVHWDKVETRLLVGATEILQGCETVFDSALNAPEKNVQQKNPWRKRLPLSLEGVAASGTLPEFAEAVQIGKGCFWDGLYSQNPPLREFFSGVPVEDTPDELWIVRINPQQCPERPATRAEIIDRENEMQGNLSLNKELDFLLTVNQMIKDYGGKIAKDYKPVTVRTIKMMQTTAYELRYSSKFDRRRAFTERLRLEGTEVARAWLKGWPDPAACWPMDAGYP